MKWLLIFFVFFQVSFSQTREEIDLLISGYNKSEIFELNNKLNESNLIRQNRIQKFINGNMTVKRVFFDIDNTKFKIFDIIDGKVVYISTDNINAAKSTRANFLNSGGALGLNLNGENMNVATWDGGPTLNNHIEFQLPTNSNVYRVTTPDASASNSESLHSTHVSGTIIARGANTNAKGMAPYAYLKSFDWDNDETEVLNEATVNGLLLSNHSYGVPVFSGGSQNAPTWYMGCYSSDARAWDQISYAAPYYLMVASAGNDGDETYSGGLLSGYDKLTGNKNAKNNLVVANAQDALLHPNGSGDLLGELFINSSSSQGPSDDGRIKPDITGNGTSVFSTSNVSTSSYATLSGTSMAAPNVTGTLLLLQQYYNQLKGSYMRASTLKGLACHTADDAGNVGPDPIFGWGLLNARDAANLLTATENTIPTAIVNELSLSQGESYTFNVVVSSPKKLKATICWTDVPGTAKDNQLNSPSPALVNDLDIRINKGIETSFPWKLQLSNVAGAAIKGDNSVDTVESVEVDNALGTYTVTISHKGIISNGPQNYSLIVSGFDEAVLSSEHFENNIDEISIYPNPAKDIININTHNSLVKSYKMLDVQGRSVKVSVLNDLSDFQIDITDLDEGVYVLQLVMENQIISKKFIKK